MTDEDKAVTALRPESPVLVPDTATKSALWPARSEQVNELAAALAKAQSKITGASKDKTNPAFQSRYATMDSVLDACREPLSTNGIAVIQNIVESNRNVVAVETVLVHSSGQWVAQVVRLPVDKPTAQGVGSAVTYARRYGLSAAAGVAPTDDDDGNAASGKAVSVGPPSGRGGSYVKPQGKPDPRLSPDQNKAMESIFKPGA